MPLTDHAGGEILEPEQCRWLLRSRTVGRLAVISEGRPLIFPVNYAFADDEVVFRTSEGTKMSAALAEPVAFEIDDLDEGRRTGWSVLVQGRAALITKDDRPNVQSLTRVPLEPWQRGKVFWLRIAPTSITGRRVERAT